MKVPWTTEPGIFFVTFQLNPLGFFVTVFSRFHRTCWPIHKAREAPRWPLGCMPWECCAPSPGIKAPRKPPKRLALCHGEMFGCQCSNGSQSSINQSSIIFIIRFLSHYSDWFSATAVWSQCDRMLPISKEEQLKNSNHWPCYFPTKTIHQ